MGRELKMNGYPPPHPKWPNGDTPRAPFTFIGVAERPPQAGLELPHRLEQLLGLGLEIRDERLQGLQEAPAVAAVRRPALGGRLDDVRAAVLRMPDPPHLPLPYEALDHRRQRRRCDPELTGDLAGCRGAGCVQPARHGVLRRRHVAALDDLLDQPSR